MAQIEEHYSSQNLKLYGNIFFSSFFYDHQSYKREVHSTEFTSHSRLVVRARFLAQRRKTKSKRTNRIKANKSNQSKQIESKRKNRKHCIITVLNSMTNYQNKKNLWRLNLQDLIFVFHFNDFLLL